MLIVDDDFLDKKDLNKMESIEKMRLIKRGRARASEELRRELEKYRGTKAEALAEASEEWMCNHPVSNSDDLEQYRKDSGAKRQVMKLEMEQEQADYLNDPKLCDEDSHKRLH